VYTITEFSGPASSRFADRSRVQSYVSYDERIRVQLRRSSDRRGESCRHRSQLCWVLSLLMRVYLRTMLSSPENPRDSRKHRSDNSPRTGDDGSPANECSPLGSGCRGRGGRHPVPAVPGTDWPAATVVLAASSTSAGNADRTVFASGIVEGRCRETEQNFELAGRLVSINVSEGQRVGWVNGWQL